MIIGLYGPQGCGKSTIALATSELDDRFWRRSFAGVLRERLKLISTEEVSPYNGDIKNDPQDCYNGHSVREMLQKDGAFQRSLNPDVFLNTIKEFYRHLIVDSSNYVLIVDDLRYNNERDFIKSSGGKIVFIDRDIDLKQHGQDVESERDWKTFKADLTIKNVTGETPEVPSKQLKEFIDNWHPPTK